MESSSSIMLLLVKDFYSLHSSVQSKVFHELYRQIYPGILHMLNDSADAEDIVHEVFLKAINRPPIANDENQLRAWLKVVARNTTLNFIRKNKKYRNHIDLERVFVNDEMVSGQETVERDVELRLFEEDINFFLNRLKPEYRELIILKWKKQLSYKEIAQEMDSTEAIVRQKLHRARESLKKLVEAKWGGVK